MLKKRKNNKKNAISLKLRDLRKSLGLRQDEFAQSVGIGTRTLASWESGEIEPTIRRIHIILQVASKISPEAVSHYFSEFDWFTGSLENNLVHRRNTLNLKEGELEKMYKEKFYEQIEKTNLAWEAYQKIVDENSALRSQLVKLQAPTKSKNKAG